MKRAVVLGAVVALAVAAAGCGGGGGGENLSADEYSEQLNRICTDFNQKSDEIGEPQSLQDLGDKGDQLLDEFEDAIARGKDLKPPAELEDAADEFISLSEQQADLIRRAIAAAKAGDEAKANEIGRQLDPITTKSQNLATNDLNVPACAE